MGGRRWESDEIAVLRSLYPQGGVEAVHDALPDRSLPAIAEAARRHVLCRRRGPNQARLQELAGQRFRDQRQLKELRLAAGLRQREAAARSGWSIGVISNAENGLHIIGLAGAIDLLEAYGFELVLRRRSGER